MRAKTMYEATFRPISRPAPSDRVTPEQPNAWDALVQEVNLALTNVGTAASNANAAAQEAREAGNKLDRMTVSASTLDPGSEATAEISEAGGRKHVAFGIPQGPRGEQGVPGVFSINGKEVTNEAEVTLTPQDIGAIPVGTQMSRVVKVEFDLAYARQIDGWYACTADAEGVLETEHVIADMDLSDQQASVASDLRDAYALIARMDMTENGKITAYFSGEPSKSVPSVAYIPVKLLIV